MKVKNILFDLDGTIIEPQEGIINSVLYSLNKMGIKETYVNDLKKFIGPPLIDSFKEHYKLNEESANKAIIYYREYFSRTGINENSLYDKIENLLIDLHRNKINLFIATSKPTVYAKQIMKSYRLDSYFKQIVGSNLDNTRKDKEEIIDYVLTKNQLSKNETIMIGDRSFDIIGSKKNGIESIGVTYGHGSAKELKTANANYIVETVEQLENLLKKKT